MSRETRVRLDAPFVRAASGPFQSRPETTPDQGFQRPANDSALSSPASDFSQDRHLRRPAVPQRGQADYSGEMMDRYINGLDARLIDHIRKHAPRWHQQETRRILLRWTVPAADHPAPSWAMPRNVQAEARDYAGQLVRERIVAKMRRLHDIRVARTLGGHGQVDPLHLLFHSPSTAPQQRNRQKL